jgi:hypothetical protein
LTVILSKWLCASALNHRPILPARTATFRLDRLAQVAGALVGEVLDQVNLTATAAGREGASAFGAREGGNSGAFFRPAPAGADDADPVGTVADGVKYLFACRAGIWKLG